MTQKKEELTDVMNDSLITALANTHTILIARIEVVGATTIDVQPVIQRVVDGNNISLPIFPQVPPVFLQGGTSYDAHPIAVGDYCLLLVSERCFDRWYMGEDGLPPLEMRMHDYSDCFALVGVNPASMAKTIPTTIERFGDSTVTGAWIHTGSYDLTGPLTVTGDTTTIGNTDSTTYSANGDSGATGVFVSADAKTITVTAGLITNIA